MNLPKAIRDYLEYRDRRFLSFQTKPNLEYRDRRFFKASKSWSKVFLTSLPFSGEISVSVNGHSAVWI